MPLFLCGCVEGPELLTNAPLSHLFPCGSSLDWTGPICTLTQRISCACSAVGVWALQSQHKTKDLNSFMQFYWDERRFEHSTKQIKERLDKFTCNLDNDGKCARKYSFCQPPEYHVTTFYCMQSSTYTVLAKWSLLFSLNLVCNCEFLPRYCSGYIVIHIFYYRKR